MEIPMLVTNVGDLSNMVKHDVVGQVCENDIDSIASALRQMNDHKKLSSYSLGVAKEKKRFEWGVLCDNIDAL
jgi:glycosyltransferase involved in cell wall biosynthesis